MNPRHTSTRCGAPPLRLIPAVATLLLLPARMPGADAPAVPVPPPSKPYTLYLGADLSIEKEGKLCPVVGVQRDSFVIDADGKRLRVRDTDLRMKIDSVLKMTTAYATIAGLKAERAYTPASDPRHHAREAVALAQDNSANVDLAVATLDNMERVSGFYDAMVANWNPLNGPPPPPTVTQTDRDGAATTLNRNSLGQGSDINSVPRAISQEQMELSRELFDAFSLSFAISSRQTLADPYLVVVVRFREKADSPKTARLLVYAQVLPTIDEKPQTVRLFRGGFPPGYQLEDCQVHIYNNGPEIPTSASPKQTAITSDEAFQFSVVDYSVQNHDRTVPPAPARAFWPKDLPTRLSVKKLDRPLFVKIGKNGKASGFFSDDACTRPVDDAELEAVRPDLRFFPALQKGKPVESVVAFNLGQRAD